MVALKLRDVVRRRRPDDCPARSTAPPVCAQNSHQPWIEFGADDVRRLAAGDERYVAVETGAERYSVQLVGGVPLGASGAVLSISTFRTQPGSPSKAQHRLHPPPAAPAAPLSAGVRCTSGRSVPGSIVTSAAVRVRTRRSGYEWWWRQRTRRTRSTAGDSHRNARCWIRIISSVAETEAGAHASPGIASTQPASPALSQGDEPRQRRPPAATLLLRPG